MRNAVVWSGILSLVLIFALQGACSSNGGTLGGNSFGGNLAKVNINTKETTLVPLFDHRYDLAALLDAIDSHDRVLVAEAERDIAAALWAQGARLYRPPQGTAARSPARPIAFRRTFSWCRTLRAP